MLIIVTTASYPNDASLLRGKRYNPKRAVGLHLLNLWLDVVHAILPNQRDPDLIYALGRVIA